MRRSPGMRSLSAQFAHLTMGGLGLCVALLAGGPGWAQAPVSDPNLGAAPNVESLIDTLDPENPNRLRGIRVPGAPPDVTATPRPGDPGPGMPADIATTTAPPEMPAVSLTVTFATGSATLSPQAEAVLDNLGQALASPRLARFRFRVEGHTDSVGTASANQELSERRAEAVRDELVKRHGIDPTRVVTRGHGEQQLLIPTPDETPEPRNRRVQIVNLGG